MTEGRVIDNTYLKLESTYTELPKIFYSKQNPSEVPSPEFVVFNDSLAHAIGLNNEFFKSNDGIGMLCGNKILKDSTPISQAYAAHQFGCFTMLGDGRAVLLGEYAEKNGSRLDIQLKGSGRTPYSRGGDGKAALGPMLREYIISEAMNFLGISTTRSLAVVKTGEYIQREKLLDGAVLTRIAKSHIRVGTFQFAAEFGTVEDLKSLADYTLERHFPKDCCNRNPYVYLLNEVIRKQAELIAKWQLVGFIHGVMNTDNVSICGETIDYGPCAFMDEYDPNTVFSSIDTNGRYAYGNQPKIGAWNLTRFAETLLPLLDENSDKAVKIAEDCLAEYTHIYHNFWYSGMRRKLGLFFKEDNDQMLISSLLEMMKKYQADYTNTFYNLTIGNFNGMDIFKSADFKEWHKSWEERLKRQDSSEEEIFKLMEKNNPSVIPRNHRVEEALRAAVKNNDLSVMNSLLVRLKHTYDYSEVDEYYTQLPPKTGCAYKTYCGT